MFSDSFSTFGKFACGFVAAVGALAMPVGAPAQAAEEPLFAVLNGGNECDGTAPPAGPLCRKGDPDGFGSATVIFPTDTSLCFAILVDNLLGASGAPNAAHIHSGIAGVNGSVVVTLKAPVAPSASNPGVSAGCVSNVAAGTIAAIKADPTAFYVNVHNAEFSGGAVRGQLF